MTDIKSTIRGPVPRIPFEDIALSILGDSYELSLVICGDTLARRMYVEHRKHAVKGLRPTSKTYASNVLSFPLSKTDGEIFLNIRKAQREARQLGTTPSNRLAYLFIHGCFHLKGFDHSDEMEAAEARIMKRFSSSK